MAQNNTTKITIRVNGIILTIELCNEGLAKRKLWSDCVTDYNLTKAYFMHRLKCNICRVALAIDNNPLV